MKFHVCHHQLRPDGIKPMHALPVRENQFAILAQINIDGHISRDGPVFIFLLKISYQP